MSIATRPLIDDVVTAVHVQRFAGDESCGIMCQECSGKAYVIDADETVGRRFGFRLLQQVIEFRDAQGGSSGKRPRRDRVDADTLRTEFGRDIAHCAFQCCLRNSRDIVMLDDHPTAVVGHSEERPRRR